MNLIYLTLIQVLLGSIAFLFGDLTLLKFHFVEVY